MTQFATLTYTYTSGAWYAFCYCFVPVFKISITSKPLKLQDPGCSTMISMVRHEVSGHLGTISWEKFGFWYFIELVPPSGLCVIVVDSYLDLRRGNRCNSGLLIFSVSSSPPKIRCESTVHLSNYLLVKSAQMLVKRQLLSLKFVCWNISHYSYQTDVTRVSTGRGKNLYGQPSLGVVGEWRQSFFKE